MFSTKLALCMSMLIIIPSCLGDFSMKCENPKKYMTIFDSSVKSCPPRDGDSENKYCCTNQDGSMYCCDASKFLEENGLREIDPDRVFTLTQHRLHELDPDQVFTLPPFPDNFGKHETINHNIGFVIPIMVSIFVALMIVCCVCCLCCPCCFLYKSRNRGTVYNNIPVTVQPHQQQGVNTSVYQQQPPPYPVMQMQQHPPQAPYPPVPPHGVPMTQQYPLSPYPPAVPPHGVALPPQGQQQPPPYSEATGAGAGDKLYARQAPYNPNF